MRPFCTFSSFKEQGHNFSSLPWRQFLSKITSVSDIWISFRYFDAYLKYLSIIMEQFLHFHEYSWTEIEEHLFFWSIEISAMTGISDFILKKSSDFSNNSLHLFTKQAMPRTEVRGNTDNLFLKQLFSLRSVTCANWCSFCRYSYDFKLLNFQQTWGGLLDKNTWCTGWWNK